MTWSKVPVRLKEGLRLLRKTDRLAGSDGKNDAEARAQKANRLAGRGRFAEAEAVLTEAAAELPDHPALLEGLVQVAQRRNDWPEVLKRARFLAERHPDLIRGWMMTAKALTELNYFAEAERVLTETAAKWPDHMVPLEARARVAQRQKNKPEALKRWRALAERHPHLVRARIHVAQALLKLHQPKQAKVELAETLTLWPDHVGVRLAMVDVLLQLGQVAEAEELLIATGIQSPDDPAPDDPAPDDPAIMEAWAHLCEHRQRWPEALRRWQALTDRHPDKIGHQTRTHTALCLFKLGRIDDARSIVAEIVGSREEGQVFNDLFGPCAPMVSYYGRQIEDTFRNVT